MTTARRLAAMAFWAVASVAGLALALFLFAWSGLYNVAASRGHWAIVEWLLAFGMRNSVESACHADTGAGAGRP